jgi:hypothetical protein
MEKNREKAEAFYWRQQCSLSLLRAFGADWWGKLHVKECWSPILALIMEGWQEATTQFLFALQLLIMLLKEGSHQVFAALLFKSFHTTKSRLAGADRLGTLTRMRNVPRCRTILVLVPESASCLITSASYRSCRKLVCLSDDWYAKLRFLPSLRLPGCSIWCRTRFLLAWLLIPGSLLSRFYLLAMPEIRLLRFLGNKCFALVLFEWGQRSFMSTRSSSCLSYLSTYNWSCSAPSGWSSFDLSSVLPLQSANWIVLVSSCLIFGWSQVTRLTMECHVLGSLSALSCGQILTLWLLVVLLGSEHFKERQVWLCFTAVVC